MIVLIAIIATLNLALGYWLGAHFAPVLETAKAIDFVSAAAAASEESTDQSETENPVAADPVIQASHQRKVAPNESPTVAERVSEPPVRPAPTPTTQPESEPARSEPAEAEAEAETEPEAEPEADDQSDLMAGIASFRAQLAESALQTVDEPQHADNTETDEPADAKAPSSQESDDGGGEPVSPADADAPEQVAAGIAAFREQLALMKAGGS